ncbi:MAG: deoxyribodipyrimidine photo-lyase [Pseudomonadota bacterium]
MSSESLALVWLRRDLRLDDNPALRHALDHHAAVVPVYVGDDQDDDWAPGGASRAWLNKSLTALNAALEEHGSRLIVRRGPAEQALDALLDETGASAIYWNRLYDPYSRDRDERLKKRCRERGLIVESFNGHLLIEPWQVATGSGNPYKVFTPFWKNVVQRLPLREPCAQPRELRPPASWPTSHGIEALALEPSIRWDRGFWEAFEPGEAGAVAQLRRFTRGALTGYAEMRDFPADDGVSRLSAHLHFGEISALTVWQAVAAVQNVPRVDVDGYLRELGWREFAHHVLYYFAHTPTEPLVEKYRNFPWRNNHEAMLQAWQRGETGIPLVDAGMRQLWQTGWMHNRVRMVVASFLVKNIRAPWLAGARWFWDTLVDADLASNTMGWQWAAGCGADAAPYFRVFNPVLQSQKFDKTGDYIRRYVPELAALPDKALHEPWLHTSSDFVPGTSYPMPIVDLKTSRQQALDALAALDPSKASKN